MKAEDPVDVYKEISRSDKNIRFSKQSTFAEFRLGKFELKGPRAIGIFIAAIAIFVVLLSLVVLFWNLYAGERQKTNGVNYALRTETIFTVLPRSGKGGAVEGAQGLGMLAKDAVIVADEFYCLPSHCFFVPNVLKYYTAFVRKNSTVQVEEFVVALPQGMRFVKAERCADFKSRKCHVLMMSAEGKQHFGVITNPNRHPIIEDNGPVSAKHGMEIKAFSSSSGRFVEWFNDTLLINVNHINILDPLARTTVAVIRNVRRDDVIQMLELKDRMIIIVMDNVNVPEGKETRVRIFEIVGKTVISHDMLTLASDPTVIDVFARGERFEICTGVGVQIICYVHLSQ